ncbi:MAG TPA: lytic transglycosylase domain-containing protein [Kiritimatiellia bacterium]|nr:lytic transglycosylase domain-containing protein [Kiritimatiellia bacterium]HMO99617.1 lytic transglycosylase domain-containing protein [Kiritimatiellia bacterium]HMP96716.1 lytic transglycosylase domain-containing protein [Kiritimatiellia bacterium]
MKGGSSNVLRVGAAAFILLTASCRDTGRLDASGGDVDPLEAIRTSLVAEFSSPEWRGVWEQVYRALASDDELEAAWLKPEAEAILTLLRSREELIAYADWFEQKSDYLYAAYDAVEACAPADYVRAPVPTEYTVMLAPPRPEVATPLAPEIKATIESMLYGRAEWDRRLADRPLPARAPAMKPVLRRIFIEEGVPPELIWVAEVESTFNPAARSPVGAVGLFQFMPATAKAFGLRVSPVDQRLDPEKNARAAAQYLRQLYRRFGSWPLALAAYNGGQGRVARLLNTHEGATFNDIAAALPAETRMYVPRVMALIALREDMNPDLLPSAALSHRLFAIRYPLTLAKALGTQPVN